MKETILSTCEKTFLRNALDEHLRIDGRGFKDYRNISICFGREWGNCSVTIGDTRVLAQVSCDIQQPKASKPNEGLLHVNVEMSMAALHYEQGRQSEISIQVNRLLEKCLKESKCVDLEALCIVAEEKAWNIRIDLNVMNYEGNLAGCCSIAALASLAHFRHPDVTSTGEKIIVHSHSEKAPIPINLHHYPVIVSYALFNNGQHILSDPTFLEERVADSLLLLSVNSYREFCGMHFEGAPLPSCDVVVKCSKDASDVGIRLVKKIKDALASDLKKRSEQKSIPGLSASLNLDHILSKIQETLKIPLKPDSIKPEPGEKRETREIKMEMEIESAESDDESEFEGTRHAEYCIKNIGNNTAELVTKNEAESETSDGDEDDDDSDTSEDENEYGSMAGGDEADDDVEIIKEIKPSESIDEIQLSGDSEEEEVVVLQSNYKK